jgi:hypothetical protein
MGEDNIKKYLEEGRLEVVDWILLAEDRNKWRAVVYTVLNLRVPYNKGMTRLADRMLTSQEGPLTPGVNNNNKTTTMSVRLKGTSTSERSKNGLASLHPAWQRIQSVLVRTV